MTRSFPIKTSGRRSVPDIMRARTAITARTAFTSIPILSTIIGWCPTSFQGTCECPNSCWNQHGRTFDSALRSAFNIQLSSRGRYPPVQFRSEEGGTMRQINHRDAARIIMHTMGDFRRREVRKWKSGTHFTEYHDYEVWDRSIDADRVRSEYRRSQEVARMNDVPRARSPRTTRRPSPRRASSRRPSASWTNRTVNTPPRGRSSFPPVRETPSSSTTTRPFFDLSFAETTDNESNAPSFGGGAGSAFRPGDAEDAQPQARVPRQTSPAQRWLQAPSTTPVIQEVIDLEQDGTVPPAAPPTRSTVATLPRRSGSSTRSS